MAEQKIATQVTFTALNEHGEEVDVTVTGPAAKVLGEDAASNTIDFDADVEYGSSAAKKRAPKATAKAPAEAE